MDGASPPQEVFGRKVGHAHDTRLDPSECSKLREYGCKLMMDIRYSCTVYRKVVLLRHLWLSMGSSIVI